MSGLFEAPFLYQPESIPLRRRENDAFASPSRRRRRHDHDHWCIRSAMKAILISPILVLLVWSIAAVAFTHRMKGMARGSSHTKRNVIVQPNRNAPPIVTQGHYYSFPTEDESSPVQQLSNYQLSLPHHAPMQRQTNELPVIYQQLQTNAQPIQLQAAAYPPAQEGNPGVAMPLQGMQSPEVILPVAQATSEGTVPLHAIPMQPQGSSSITTNTVTSSSTTESVAAPPPLNPALPDPQSPPLMGIHGNLRNSVRYFYYDPHTTVQDAQGNVFLPEIVYDVNGQAIRLKSLASKSIYMAPPRTMIHHNITASNSTISYNYTHPNTIHTPVHGHDEPRKSMAMPEWGKSRTSDSSVIVGTVGVMALLVGALSARKLRSRNMLSACIENETLEDEAAYDAAHTHHYNTFQQGWKGDLEKFDV